jgi:hypothetical protein
LFHDEGLRYEGIYREYLASLSHDIQWTGLMVVTVVQNIVAMIGIPPLLEIEL